VRLLLGGRYGVVMVEWRSVVFGGSSGQREGVQVVQELSAGGC
jgi:hypothetical protein